MIDLSRSFISKDDITFILWSVWLRVLKGRGGEGRGANFIALPKLSLN